MISPSDIIGDSVVQLIREAILKQNIKPEHIYEIALDVSQAESTVQNYAKKIKSSITPCCLFFITHLYRPDDSHEVSLIRHEMKADGKHRTGFDYSLFSFQYRIIRPKDSKPRFRFDYIKAREDLRTSLVMPAIVSILEFGKKNYAGMSIEIRADNVIAGYMASKVLENARFIKIGNNYEIAQPFKPDFLSILQKLDFLSLEELSHFQNLLSKPVKIQEKNPHWIEIHNKLIDHIRKNFAKNCKNSSDEVSYFYSQLMQNDEMESLLKKSPYQGDLWIEGQQT